MGEPPQTHGDRPGLSPVQTQGRSVYDLGMNDLIGLLIGIGILLVALTLVGTLIVLAGWNWGLVGAVSFASPIGLGQAFWLSLLISGLLTVNVTNRKD